MASAEEALAAVAVAEFAAPVTFAGPVEFVIVIEPPFPVPSCRHLSLGTMFGRLVKVVVIKECQYTAFTSRRQRIRSKPEIWNGHEEREAKTRAGEEDGPIDGSGEGGIITGSDQEP
jgi:hypothetical protein